VDIGATLVAALILFRHRGNAKRLLSHTEQALPSSRSEFRRTGGA
jgi:glycerol-3-phosphate acyltransferase PlsY